MSELSPDATVGEEEIKRFRVGDILFNDEQAKMFCDLAMKGLRAEAAPTEEDVQRTVAEIFGALDPASIVRRIMLASSATASATGLEKRYEEALRYIGKTAAAGKDWRFAQFILNGMSVEEAVEAVRNLHGK